jgi:CRISPR/Cas system endoribonuclease Cas6 (RAMP superfamily)
VDGVLSSHVYPSFLFCVLEYSFRSKALHEQRVKYIPNSEVTQPVFRNVKTIQITVEQQGISQKLRSLKVKTVCADVQNP